MLRLEETTLWPTNLELSNETINYVLAATEMQRDIDEVDQDVGVVGVLYGSIVSA
jgi:hypothetical protein